MAQMNVTDQERDGMGLHHGTGRCFRHVTPQIGAPGDHHGNALRYYAQERRTFFNESEAALKVVDALMDGQLLIDASQERCLI